MKITDNFTLEECEYPDLDDTNQAQVLIKCKHISVDPYMRNRLNAKNYFMPLAIGDTMSGDVVGEIVASNNPNFKVGR